MNIVGFYYLVGLFGICLHLWNGVDYSIWICSCLILSRIQAVEDKIDLKLKQIIEG